MLTQAQQFLCDPKTGRPNFAVIARQIGDRLAGETLFSGMGPCEIVLPEYGGSSSLDLMTPPRRAARGNTSFSMVARITAVSYTHLDVYKRQVLRRPNAGDGWKNSRYEFLPLGDPQQPGKMLRFSGARLSHRERIIKAMVCLLYTSRCV